MSATRVTISREGLWLWLTRPRYRWHWSVEWETAPGQWEGVGGWSRTKARAEQCAMEAGVDW